MLKNALNMVLEVTDMPFACGLSAAITRIKWRGIVQGIVTAEKMSVSE
jgi:hypothetical protein